MPKGKVQKKKAKTLTNVSFMYVCVAGNGEMLVFFLVFSPNNSLIDIFGYFRLENTLVLVKVPFLLKIGSPF